MKCTIRYICFVFLMLACACGSKDSDCGPTRGEVTSITDGDTIKISADGENYTVRLLLVDTPETTKGKEECYGLEATKFVTAQLRFKKVKLSYEAGDECKDMYDRLLAYVTVDGSTVSINEQLVADGYARVCRIECDESRYSEFSALEYDAQTSAAGLWNPATCPDAYKLSTWGASGCNKSCR